VLLGEYEYTVDDRGRLAIPARLREPFLSGLVLARGLEPCIVVYPTARWNGLADRMTDLPPNSTDARRWQRAIFPSAFQAELDRQGRVLLPQTLRDYAGIEANVVIIGMHSTLEIWSRDAWRTEQALLNEQAASIAEAVSLPVGQAGLAPGQAGREP